MVELIAEVDFRAILGNVIQNDDYSGGRILPYTQRATDNWLVPEIGIGLYESIVDFLNDNAGNHDEEKYTALLGVVRKVVAWGAYNDYLPFSLGKDTGNGIVEEVSENTKAVRIGVLEKRIDATKINLGQSIDNLMGFLFVNRADYPIWGNSDEGKASLRLFVRSGVELGKALPESGGSYWLFKRMRENFIQKTDEVMEPVIGEELLDKIKADLEANEFEEPYKQLRKLCANYLSYWVYAYILPTTVVGFTDTGVLRVLSEFDGINNAKTPTEEQLNRLIAGLERSKSDALKTLQVFLKKNAEEIPEYEVVVKDPANLMQKPPFMRNREKKRIFGL
jgi:hypothetical protein